MAVAVSGHTARATRDRRGKKERAKEERKKGRKPWSPVAARTAGVEHAARRYNAAADPSDKKWRSSQRGYATRPTESIRAAKYAKRVPRLDTGDRAKDRKKKRRAREKGRRRLTRKRREFLREDTRARASSRLDGRPVAFSRITRRSVNGTRESREPIRTRQFGAKGIEKGDPGCVVAPHRTIRRAGDKPLA